MKYYCIRQQDITDCGAACLATISIQNGYKISISKIRETAGTDTNGTNVKGLVQAAEEIGFTAKAYRLNEEAFFSKFPLPCIAHVIVEGQLLHYVVIHKITPKKIIIADPAKGIIKLKTHDFLGEQSSSKKYWWTGIVVLFQKSETFQKGVEKKETRSRFIKLLSPQKKLIINIFVASIIYTILGIGAAFYFQELVDNILPNNLIKSLTTLSVGVILLNIFRVLLNTLRTHLLIYMSQKLDIDLLLNYYKHVIQLPVNFFATRKVGEIISRFNDASKVRDALSGATVTIMIDTIMAIVGAIILYMQNAKMFMASLLVAMCYLAIVVGFNRVYKVLNRNQMEDNSQLTSYLVESLNGVQTVKTFNAERKVIQVTEKKFIRLLKSIFKLGSVENFQNSLKDLVQTVGGIVIIWIGGVSVISGEITMGQLITFNSLLMYFLDPLKNIVNLQPQLQAAKIAADRLGEILELEIEKGEDESVKINTLSGDIEFRDVCFRYGTRKRILHDINMTIHKGEKIAIIGESGCGKTTLIKLLLRLYPTEKGHILIGGNNIEDIKMDILRDKIAYIPQEVFLFSGTIYENLILGVDKAPLEEVIKAAKAAEIHEFINLLPMRYNTRLEEQGLSLSGGQRQRIAIARAILKKPDVLIFDEATSNLDTITEYALGESLKAISSNVTTIFVAHRLSTIRQCESIFVMSKGHIIESGSHEQLYKLNGRYTEFVNQQSLNL
ncbi:ABC-type bacteriocin transporter [Lachnospiraceae bacterium PM6-15]|uniref:peptidase domain-containing ABC transporter n=1 Tax=Ohessyouella blattaphilus TaxID=2949333 RepID=UPI003E2785B3